MSGTNQSVTSLASVSPKSGSLGCMVDETVMGDLYPRLLREMALTANVEILIGDRIKDADRLLCSGKGVHTSKLYPKKPLILLAPEKIQEGELNALSARSEVAKILIPEIDEDGRVGFWDEVVEGVYAANFQKTALSGVGNRVDWAWSEVIELVKME